MDEKELARDLSFAQERANTHAKLEAQREAHGLETDLDRYLTGKEYLD